MKVVTQSGILRTTPLTCPRDSDLGWVLGVLLALLTGKSPEAEGLSDAKQITRSTLLEYIPPIYSHLISKHGDILSEVM